MAEGRRAVMPPVYFAAALIAQLVLHSLLPLGHALGTPLTWFGFALAVGAAGFVIATARRFDVRGTTIRPFEESNVLMTDGPYARSRNPIYTSMALLLWGTAIFLGSLSPFLVPPVFTGLIAIRFIAKEEEMLEERFASTYLDYKGRVRRWL